MKKKIKIINKLKNPKVIILLILIIILLILLGTKLFLWIKLLLGNDMIINLHANPKNLLLHNNETEKVNIKTSIITNPFCDAICNYEFKDISKNITIDKQNASIKVLNSLNKEYDLVAPSKGEGQLLYRLDIQCKSNPNLLCHTSGEINKKTVLVTLNYNLSNEQLILKENFKENYFNITQSINRKIAYLDELQLKLNNTFLSKNKIVNLNIALTNLNNSTTNSTNYWNSQDYKLASNELNKIKEDYSLLEIEFNMLNNSISNDITLHNQLSFIINDLVNNVTFIITIPLNETDIELGENLVNSTNKIIDNLKSMSILSQEIKILNLNKQVTNFLNTEKEYSEDFDKISISLENYTPNYIMIDNVIPSPSNLSEPSPICCFFNDCKACCENECYDDSVKYPLIFIHGHSFSDSISPELNLNIFEELQRSLENFGYLNAGSLIPGDEETEGVLGRTNYPISLKASYYFDSIQEEGKINTLYTKQDNIDTYSIRLKEIIDEVKKTTNRKKVNLVTHSMGGLVARRYIQIFGSDSVNKVILIASPNHGVNKDVHTSCILFGSDKECDDMHEKSLLINKLNLQKDLGDSKVYNIIGVGCNTYNENGDGVIQNSSAYLDFANNYYIYGSCKGNFNLLHSDIINPLKTTQITNLVMELLED